MLQKKLQSIKSRTTKKSRPNSLHLLFILLFLISIMLCGCESTRVISNQAKIIYVATSGSTKPYIYTNENNEITGHDVLVLEEIFSRLPNYELEFIKTEFSSIFTGLSAGIYDIGANNLAYNEERAENFYFSYPYKKVTYSFLQRIEDEPLTSLADAASRKYVTEVTASGNAANSITKWNEEHPDSNIELQYTNANYLVQYQNIIDGVTDFSIHDIPLALSYLEEFNLGDQLKITEISDNDTSSLAGSIETYFIFPKTEEGKKLRDEVNQVLEEIYEDQTLLELSLTSFGYDQVPDQENFEREIN